MWEHGTANGYNNHDCRCKACREAWRVHRIDYRRQRGIPPRAPRGTNITHGTISAYRTGCHCALCSEKARTDRAKYRARARSLPSVQPTAVIPFGPFAISVDADGRVKLN